MKLPEPITVDEIRRRRDELIAEIDRAFDTTLLGGGIGPLEAAAIDNYSTTDDERAAARKEDHKVEHWRDYDLAFLAAFDSFWVFSDDEGRRFVLPAALTAHLRYCLLTLHDPKAGVYRGSLCFEPSIIFASIGDALLSPSQRAAAAGVLLLSLEDDFAHTASEPYGRDLWAHRSDNDYLMRLHRYNWADSLSGTDRTVWQSRWLSLCDDLLGTT